MGGATPSAAGSGRCQMGDLSFFLGGSIYYPPGGSSMEEPNLGNLL
jgi:hypothetical protein